MFPCVHTKLSSKFRYNIHNWITGVHLGGMYQIRLILWVCGSFTHFHCSLFSIVQVNDDRDGHSFVPELQLILRREWSREGGEGRERREGPREGGRGRERREGPREGGRESLQWSCRECMQVSSVLVPWSSAVRLPHTLVDRKLVWGNNFPMKSELMMLTFLPKTATFPRKQSLYSIPSQYAWTCTICIWRSSVFQEESWLAGSSCQD